MEWKWVEPALLPDVAVHFKINIYKRMAEELAKTESN